MVDSEFWVKAGHWARARFECERKGCGRNVRRILVKEGEPQTRYCYAHYLEATTPRQQSTDGEAGK